MPELRLDLAALDRNIEVMRLWCAERGVDLCPHVKTTMTREIVERQAAAGAWGVTVATVPQAAVTLRWGQRRIMIANEVVDPAELAQLRRWLDAVPELELTCFVDSAEGVRRASAAFAGAPRPLAMLVDVGTPDGRTGVRDPGEAVALAGVVAGADGVVLAGVAGYEGVRPNRRDPDNLAQVRQHCRTTADVFAAALPLVEIARPIYSMGGSAFPDLVVEAMTEITGVDRDAYDRVLRSGCYVTHDHGTYAGVSPIAGLRPALTVRATVLSAPEPGLVVLGAGKRELPYDAGLPVVLGVLDADSGSPRPGAGAVVRQLFDHHAVLTGAHGVRVGDLVDLGISHPCSAFDRWRTIAVVDDAGATLETWAPDLGS